MSAPLRVTQERGSGPAFGCPAWLAPTLLPQRILCSSFLLGSSKLNPCQIDHCPSQGLNNCRYSRHAGLEHDPTPWLIIERLLDGYQAWCPLVRVFKRLIWSCWRLLEEGATAQAVVQVQEGCVSVSGRSVIAADNKAVC